MSQEKAAYREDTGTFLKARRYSQHQQLWQTALLCLHGMPAPGTQQAASFLQVHLCRHQGQQPPMQHSQGKGEAAGRLVRWAESREGRNAVLVDQVQQAQLRTLQQRTKDAT